MGALSAKLKKLDAKNFPTYSVNRGLQGSSANPRRKRETYEMIIMIEIRVIVLKGRTLRKIEVRFIFRKARTK